MKPNRWPALTDGPAPALAEQLDRLMAQREVLFHQQHTLRERLAALAQEKRDLSERRTIHELHWYLFWRRLRQDADAPPSEKTEITSATDPLSHMEV